MDSRQNCSNSDHKINFIHFHYIPWVSENSGPAFGFFYFSNLSASFGSSLEQPGAAHFQLHVAREAKELASLETILVFYISLGLFLLFLNILASKFLNWS